MQTFEYRSKQRPSVQTHVFFMIDTFIEFLLSDLSPEREYKIITNHYCKPIGNGPFILFNIEQLTRPKILEEVYRRSLESDIHEVWDYSEINVQLLRSRGIAAKLVTVQTTPERIAYLQTLMKTEKIYDIGFWGVIPERRMKILHELEKKGLKVFFVSRTYGHERDQEMAKCRFHINIHQTEDHKIFESVRCDPWLKAGMRIISEQSLQDDERCINASYETLVDVTTKMVRFNTL